MKHKEIQSGFVDIIKKAFFDKTISTFIQAEGWDKFIKYNQDKDTYSFKFIIQEEISTESLIEMISILNPKINKK